MEFGAAPNMPSLIATLLYYHVFMVNLAIVGNLNSACGIVDIITKTIIFIGLSSTEYTRFSFYSLTLESSFVPLLLHSFPHTSIL